MLWYKAWHIMAMVAWFAGLFYLPRIFVYHATTTDTISLERFVIMERRLYFGIMWPAAILTAVFGFAIVYQASDYYLHQVWFQIKLAIVLVLWFYHLSLWYFLQQFKHQKNKHGSQFYRLYNELPTLVLIAVVLLVVLKPSWR
ncbi:MAG: TIGR00701 family protein [Gammaproteobacteria bacterium]|nr:TIGR00701 family protein [Gammaproteobacteria bacterium]